MKSGSLNIVERSDGETCGVGPFRRMECLQRFASLAWYTATLCLVILTVSASYTYMSAMQSTTQTVFSFSALHIGVWYASFEVGSILANIFVSYFFSKKSVPKVLSFGLILTSLGCLLHGLPHFFIDYQDKLQSTEGGTTAAELLNRTLCGFESSLSPVTTESTSSGSDSSTQSMITIIIYVIAGFLNGFGYAPFYSLGIAYIDDNASKERQSTMYIGFVMASYSIGPIMGFGLGGVALGIYVTLGETFLTTDDSGWIGAWWTGYFLFGVFSLIFLPLFIMFPKRMPKSVVNSDKNENTEMEEKVETTEDSSSCNGSSSDGPESDSKLRSASGLLPTIVSLITNPVYILEVLGSTAGVYYASGWIGFLPKYFEELFFFSAQEASIYAGAVPPIIGSIAIFIGSALAMKYKFTIQRDALSIFLCCLVAMLALIPVFFLECTQYPAQSPPTNLTSCLSACGCDPQEYIPLCYDSKSYRSPCLAGCTGHTMVDNVTMYTGCFCDMDVTMARGFCQDEGCSAPYIYLACAVISFAGFFFCSTSAMNILMRVVPAEDKGIALGLHSSFNSLLAWIPAPILYGYMIDMTCEIWEYPDGTPGNPEFKGYCMEYDNEAYRLRFSGMTVGFLALCTLLCGLAWWASYLPRYSRQLDLRKQSTMGLFHNEEKQE